MPRIVHDRLRALRDERGFSMALVMGILLFAMLLGLAAFSAARGQIGVTGDDRDRKQAYAAAEAGVHFYLSRLVANNDYWTLCTYADTPSLVDRSVNRPWNGSGADPRFWRTVSGSTAKFTIELLLNDATKPCSSANLLDARGTFRIRATGEYRGTKRSIVAKFDRKRFLDFIYLTDFETTDPLAYASNQVASANTYCADKYRVQRASQSTFACQEIQFAPGDFIRGPLHSNDSLLICGTATFGRPGQGDTVESSQTPASYAVAPSSTNNCTGSPTFNTPLKAGASQLTIPETNSSLVTAAQTQGLYLTGKHTLVLRGNTIDDTPAGGSTVSRPWPTNGLIYIDSAAGTCTGTTPPRSATYAESNNCPIVTVSGTYSKPLTIASARDIVVRGDLTKTASAEKPLLGLIATQFVRVYHPVNRTGTNCYAAAGNSDPISAVRIDAAILSLQHSFTVDNFDCGTGFGNLSVTGAISQKYRGAVGQSGTVSGVFYRTGYVKDYVYDDELRYRNPPLFLDPVNAAWQLGATNEQVPAV